MPRSRRLLAAFPDERLVDQIRRGNAAAFEVVYDRHYRGILSFCRHMLGSREEAEDALQHTFTAAFGDLQSNDRDIKLKAWLYTIARNRCLSVLRARREQAAELEDVAALGGLSEEVQQRADLRELLDDLRELPHDQREALVLYEIGDLSQAEVADVIGVEPVKVKALVFQARSSLIENREAREIPCTNIREQLATASGGALRRGPLRRHLKACEGCRDYRDQVHAQRRALALVLPVVPTLGLKDSVLASLGFGGGAGGAGAAAGGAAGAAGGSGLLASIGGAGAVKLSLGAAMAAGAIAGGGVALDRATGDSGSGDGPSMAEAAGAKSASATGSSSGGSAQGSGPGGSTATPVANSRGETERADVRERKRERERDRTRDEAKRDDDRKSNNGNKGGNRSGSSNGNGNGNGNAGRGHRGNSEPARGGDGGRQDSNRGRRGGPNPPRGANPPRSQAGTGTGRGGTVEAQTRPPQGGSSSGTSTGGDNDRNTPTVPPVPSVPDAVGAGDKKSVGGATERLPGTPRE